MEELTFVTSNEDKVREAEEILGTEIEKENLELKEIQDVKLSEVVKEKARDAYEKLEKPVIVDDTGLFLNEWNGFPGALTKWVMKSKGVEGFLELAENNRDAEARTAIAFCRGEEVEIFTGTVEGEITEPRGEKGFGWDPVFRPNKSEKTFGEMEPEEKNRFSMRKKALEKLEQYLGENQ